MTTINAALQYLVGVANPELANLPALLPATYGTTFTQLGATFGAQLSSISGLNSAQIQNFTVSRHGAGKNLASSNCSYLSDLVLCLQARPTQSCLQIVRSLST